MSRLPLLAAALLFAAPLHAQHAGHAAMTTAEALPAEPGQGAFAAISEIVAMLRADPSTDWSSVDIAALRSHLVDMDDLVTRVGAVSRDVPGGLEMTIPVPVRPSAATRMIPAHAPVLSAETGWTSAVVDKGDVLVWTVAGTDEAEIRALGFHGLMAVGDHHRAHHLAIALGGRH